MQAEDRVDLRVVEHAGADHRLGTAGPFLGGLEDEHDRARELGLHSREHFGGAHQDRDVIVVASGVHHADVLSPHAGADQRLGADG